jgi:hypothetical protein
LVLLILSALKMSKHVGLTYVTLIVKIVQILWIKPTDTLNSNLIGITTLHVSGNLSAHHQEFLAYVGFGTFWPYATRSRMDLACQFRPTPGSIRSSQLHKMYQSRRTAKNSWWWAERLPETCRIVITIKLEFGASVRFIHKESVTMHGHTIVKFICECFIIIFSNIHGLQWSNLENTSVVETIM